MLPKDFSKNHATILEILKMRGALHGVKLWNAIKSINRMHKGLGMSMPSKNKAIKDLLKWKMIEFRKEGRGIGRLYSITQAGETALSQPTEGTIVLSKEFSYDLGFKKFGVADVRMRLPSQPYPKNTSFFEDAVIEPIEELCNEVLMNWNEYFLNQPIDITLEVKLNSEAIDEDVLSFRKDLLEVQDKVESLCAKWYDELRIAMITDQHGLFRYAFEAVVCEKELKERGIQLTYEEYFKMKKPILANKKSGEPLIDFCFSINGQLVDLKGNPECLTKCLIGKKFGYLHKLDEDDDTVYPNKCLNCPQLVTCACRGKMPKILGRWTILDEMEQPKIRKWISKYRQKLNEWFPYIPWEDLGFPSKLISAPCALPRDLFIPLEEQTYNTNVRMLLHFLARLPVPEAMDCWNFYFQEVPTTERFDDHAFLVTYDQVKRELKYSKMPEDIRVQVSRVGTTRTFEVEPITLLLPGRQITMGKSWTSKRKLSSTVTDFIRSRIEVGNQLSQEMHSKAKKMKIFKWFNMIYRSWERDGKPIRHTHKIFRFLKDFLKEYERQTTKEKLKPERTLDWAAHLMKTEAESITFQRQ